MSADSTRQASDSNAAQQRFLSLFLRSEREIFRYVAALVPNVTDAEDIGKLPERQRSIVEGYYYERASIGTLAQRSGRSEAATYKMLQRIREALQLCVEGQMKPEVA